MATTFTPAQNSKKFVSVFVTYCLLFITNGSAQNIQWQNTIGGSGKDLLYSTQQTTDGGYILGGWSLSSISGDKTENCFGGTFYGDYWVVKIDSSGTIQWQNTIGGVNEDWLTSIEQTSDGGFILGGTSKSSISGDKTENSWNGTYDYWIVKTDSAGNIQWQNNIGGNGWDFLYSVQQTSDGGYILGGHSDSNISGDKTENFIGTQGGYDYWIVKVDALGNIQWQNTIGGNAWDELHSIQQTTDGGYIIGGNSRSNISGDKTENFIGGINYGDYWIVKVDSLGNIQWQNTIGGTNDDAPYSIKQTTDRGYIIGGFSNSNISGDKAENSNGDYDYWVIKIDSTGNIQWQNTIGGSFYDFLTSVRQTSDRGYVLGGYSRSGISGDKTENTNGGSDYWIVKTDSSGNIEWQSTIGGNDDDQLYSIQQTAEEGYILGGYSVSNISGDKTENCMGVNDYWIIKLFPDTITSTFNIKNTISNIQLFPNPAIDELNIHLHQQTKSNQPITISVFNVLGNLIETEVTTSSKPTILNLNSFSSGVYFVEVKTGKEIYRSKFVKE